MNLFKAFEALKKRYLKKDYLMRSIKKTSQNSPEKLVLLHQVLVQPYKIF